MVNSGSQITFSISGHTANYLPMTAGDLRDAVAGKLTAYFDVLNFTVAAPSVVGALLSFQWIDYDYTGSITIQTRSDYGSVGDIASVIANAFYQASGGLPTVSTLAMQDPATSTPGLIPGFNFSDIPVEVASVWDSIKALFSKAGDALSTLNSDVLIILLMVLVAIYFLANAKSLKVRV